MRLLEVLKPRGRGAVEDIAGQKGGFWDRDVPGAVGGVEYVSAE